MFQASRGGYLGSVGYIGDFEGAAVFQFIAQRYTLDISGYDVVAAILAAEFCH